MNRSLFRMLALAALSLLPFRAFSQDKPAVSNAPPLDWPFALLLVGPCNDRGWSQAHFEAGKYVESHCPGARMLYIDKVNPSDRPGTTPAQLAEDLAAKGARLVIFSSDDMKDGAVEFARAHPAIKVISASGDDAWKDGRTYRNLPNLANVMGRVEYAKMMAGYAAALTTRTGKLGYLGPLINDETRRLAAAAYLGARYAWTRVLKKDPADLKFKVTWIGFWFNIPGVTADPTQAANDFYNTGHDVVISGLDTVEALTEAGKQRPAGKTVWAIPYNHLGACDAMPNVGLGVVYFNWGPAYLAHVKALQAGTWKPSFDWNGPDWANINNPDTSHVGFQKGPAMDRSVSTKLDGFIKDLAGGLNLWTGPLQYQDDSVFLKEGEAATDEQVWYLPNLLKGMDGQGAARK